MWHQSQTCKTNRLPVYIADKGGPSNPTSFVELHGQIYFLATAGDQAGLWRSDGTTAGILALQVGIAGSSDVPKELIVHQSALWYTTTGLGEMVVQTRKTYISLVTPRRTFARVQPTTKQRVDLGLRLERQQPGGRLQPSKIHETMPLQISFKSLEEVDAEVLAWLQQAYDQNC